MLPKSFHHINFSIIYKMISFVDFPQVMDFPTGKKSQVLSPHMSSSFNQSLYRSSTKVTTKEIDQRFPILVFQVDHKLIPSCNRYWDFVRVREVWAWQLLYELAPEECFLLHKVCLLVCTKNHLLSWQEGAELCFAPTQAPPHDPLVTGKNIPSYRHSTARSKV